MSHALDADLAVGASVNESAVTIHTGLKQQPDLAETSQIKKEIDIAAYADASMHFQSYLISKIGRFNSESKKSWNKNYVRCEYLASCLHRQCHSVYDTNFKVTPPFRGEKDRKPD